MRIQAPKKSAIKNKENKGTKGKIPIKKWKQKTMNNPLVLKNEKTREKLYSLVKRVHRFSVIALSYQHITGSGLDRWEELMVYRVWVTCGFGKQASNKVCKY